MRNPHKYHLIQKYIIFYLSANSYPEDLNNTEILTQKIKKVLLTLRKIHNLSIVRFFSWSLIYYSFFEILLFPSSPVDN